MRANSLFCSAIILAAFLFLVPVARAQVEGCPEDNCVESETSIVFNPQTNQMDAFTTATTDYNTAYYYDLCVDLAVGRLNGPYLVNATNLVPSGYPYCAAGAVQLEKSASVSAMPGRQFYAVGSAQLRVYFEYWIFVPVPTCGPYCEGYWYDAFGFSQIITTQPYLAESPSIVYTYPLVLVPVPIVYQQIAMAGSADTAWSPPVIHLVSPSQWPAGTTTTVTITGEGFGYSPDLTISGIGITNYTNPCASPNSDPVCNSTIVATVTLDANTPVGSVETITVTANGFNPSGFLPVQIQGQSGQATAQAVALALIAFRPYIVLGTGGGACVGTDISGAARSVQVGQQITVTACLPVGTSLSNVSSMSWTPITPPGTAVGGFNAINSGASSTGTVVALSAPSCTLGQAYCSFPPFYWVDQGNNRQFTFRYTLTNGSPAEATVTFNVGGPAAVSVTVTPAPTGVDIVNPPYQQPSVPVLPLLIFGGRGQPGMRFHATAGDLALGRFQWVQLIDRDSSQYLNSTGPHTLNNVPVGARFVDHAFPYGFNADGGRVGTVTTTLVADDTAEDSPFTPLIEFYGEMARVFSATMYLMWVPSADPSCVNGVACTIPVPQGQVPWSWRGDAINTLEPQVNQGVLYKRWVLNPNNCSVSNPQNYQPSISYPQWTGAINP